MRSLHLMRKYSWCVLVPVLALAACTTDKSNPSIIASFDGAKFELPESVASSNGVAYVSFLNGSVARVTADGAVTAFGNVPIDPPGSAFAEGITVDAAGNVYVAVTLASETSSFAAPGVYKIGAAGGAGTLYASNPAMKLPMDLKLDGTGNLYVTEGNGTIFKLTGTTAGTAALWKHDRLLEAAPQPGPCGARTAPFPIGANGIVVEADRVVVSNLETAAVVAIAIQPDGSAGAASDLVTSPAALCGIDGFAADGNAYLAVSYSKQSLVRIAPDGTVTTLYEGLPFRTPTGVTVGTFGTARQALVSSTDYFDAFGAGGLASAQPNLSAFRL